MSGKLPVLDCEFLYTPPGRISSDCSECAGLENGHSGQEKKSSQKARNRSFSSVVYYGAYGREALFDCLLFGRRMYTIQLLPLRLLSGQANDILVSLNVRVSVGLDLEAILLLLALSLGM